MCMKLTRASSYALHAVVYMAVQKVNKPVASHHIAQARGIPDRFSLRCSSPWSRHESCTRLKGRMAATGWLDRPLKSPCSRSWRRWMARSAVKLLCPKWRGTASSTIG